MKHKWNSPYYSLISSSGEEITIDVTASASPGLPPNKKINDAIDFFKKKGVKTILDFGSGSLRHTFPLLEAGFQVCSVEFKEQYVRPKCKELLQKAEKNPNFSALVFPQDFIKSNYKYDAVLLVYVLQTMPIPEERDYLLNLIFKKTSKESFILYMSRYNQVKDLPESHKVSDGYFMNASNKNKTFYRDFKTSETHSLFGRHKFTHIRSLGERGTDQIFVYTKNGSTLWA